jgi:hypothetical protein
VGTELVTKSVPPMVIGELCTLRFKDDLPAVVKGDPEATGEVAANNGFITKYPNNGSSVASISKFGNFHSAKVCGRENTRYLIRQSEAKIAVRGFAIRQKLFREDDIAVKTRIQKRLNRFTSLVDRDGEGNIGITVMN